MKFGKSHFLFKPQNHELLARCTDFAQSPQALVFDNFVRIYFSTREIDKDTNKHLSKICFVDYDLEFRNILSVSDTEVIALGDLGTFDEHGVFPLNVFKDGDDLYGFIGGWNRKKSISIDGSIGISKSQDSGESFKRLANGPVLTSSINEPFLVGDPFVLKNQKTYFMFYIYGQRWMPETVNEPPARVYKIGLATSTNLFDWKKHNDNQIINDILGRDECQALPSVIEHKGIFHMVFCFRYSTDFRTNSSRGYRLGYAKSKDLINWERNDGELNMDNRQNWDSEMRCYPHLVKVKSEIYLLYNGNKFGKFGFGITKLKGM